MGFKAKPTPFFITFIYLLLGILWMLFSDYISIALLPETSGYWYLQNIEDVGFLIISGLLIFFMTSAFGNSNKAQRATLKDELKEKEHANQRMRDKANESLVVVSNLVLSDNQFSKNGNVQKILDDFQSRIHLPIFIYKQLLDASEPDKISNLTFIESIVDRIQTKFNSTKGGIMVIQKVESFSFELREAILTSFIVNELMTNAYHHAFTNQKEGKLYVNMHKKDGNINLVIADNGKGLPSGFKPSEAKTSGMNLIKILVKELNAKVKYRSKPEKGTKFEVTIPTEKEESFQSVNEQWSQ